jgi:hypothetical protein
MSKLVDPHVITPCIDMRILPANNSQQKKQDATHFKKTSN